MEDAQLPAGGGPTSGERVRRIRYSSQLFEAPERILAFAVCIRGRRHGQRHLLVQPGVSGLTVWWLEGRSTALGPRALSALGWHLALKLRFPAHIPAQDPDFPASEVQGFWTDLQTLCG
ncbi:hypothetical protein VULLAG_LOCUS17986 [Vulpes lagopus]